MTVMVRIVCGTKSSYSLVYVVRTNWIAEFMWPLSVFSRPYLSNGRAIGTYRRVRLSVRLWVCIRCVVAKFKVVEENLLHE